MSKRKTPRNKDSGFVGVQLSTDILVRLDAKVAETTLNRSQIIRQALLEYLK